MKIFSEMLAEHKAKGETVFSGEDAFKLYDTYGFPIDLTEEMAEDEGMTLDQAGFDAEMEEQRVRARKAREALGDLGWSGVEFGKEVPATHFVGYDKTTLCRGQGGGHRGRGASWRTRSSPGVEAIVVLDTTPFYAEMGGQVADHGVITAEGMSCTVTDVQKNKGGKYMHYGKLTQGRLKVGDTVTATIDADRRHAIMRAHTATHLLDKALRTVLGDHVHQAGSLVEPDRLRFDFTHFSAMTPEELAQVSAMVNEAILAGYQVDTQELPIEEAKKKGAIALFGEKYGDIVRVVDMGEGYSVEFCGGTHLPNTAKVGVFHIGSEFSVASGVRRIEATTGKLSLEVMNRNQAMLFEAAAALKAKPGELREKAEAAMTEIKQLHQAVEKFKAQASLGEAQQLPHCCQERGGSEGPHRPAPRPGRQRPAPDGRLPAGQGAQRGGRAGLHQRGQDLFPGRLRQAGHRPGHQGRRPGQERLRHLRRQGRRQARQRHGRRQGHAEAG